jgi:hypothetical protein
MQTATQLLKRFLDFNDGLLVSLKLNYERNGERILKIVVAGREIVDEQEVWKNIELRLDGVVEYYFKEPENTSSQVLSNGIHMLWSKSLLGIDLGSLIDNPSSISDIRKSEMYAIGTSFSWTIDDIQSDESFT